MTQPTKVTQPQNNFAKFNPLLVVEKLPLPKYDTPSTVILDTELYLLKNYEFVDKLGMGKHSLKPWKEKVANGNIKEDFYTIYRINNRPKHLREMTLNSPKTYYDKKIGINFKYNIRCNYSFRITEPLVFIKNTASYKKNYSFQELYAYINNELSLSVLSFIGKSLLDKDISILEFNTYTKEFSILFKKHINENLLKDSGIVFSDFNFMALEFVKDEMFIEINKTLYEKAEMLLLGYDYNEKSKYSILAKRKPRIKKVKLPIANVEEGENK